MNETREWAGFATGILTEALEKAKVRARKTEARLEMEYDFIARIQGELNRRPDYIAARAEQLGVNSKGEL